MRPTITVTISGPQGAGKSILAGVLADLLSEIGIAYEIEDGESHDLHTGAFDAFWQLARGSDPPRVVIKTEQKP